MKLKKNLRLIILIIIIILASLVPFPIKFSSKDNLPKHLIENVEKKDDEDEDDILKEIF